MTSENSASLEQEPQEYGSRRAARSKMREADAVRMAATVSVVGGLLMAAAGFLPRDFFTALTAIFVVAFAIGWSRYVDRMVEVTTIFTKIVVAVVGLGAVATIRFFNDIGNLVLILAAAIILAFVADMLRPVPREHSLRSISGTVAGSFVVVTGASWVGLCDNRVWHEAAIPTGILIAAVAFVGMFIHSRKLFSVAVIIMGAVFGGIIAFTLDMFVNISERGIVLFPSLPGAVDHQNIVIVVACAIFGIVVGMIIIFASLFFRVGDTLLTHAERIALGLLPVLLCGLPLYIFVRIVGS